MEKRDARAKEWFWIDNEFIDTYARVLGVHATAVYLSLCRHVDNQTQECFPGMRLMADELAICTRTVERAISTLEKWNFISVSRTPRSDGKRQNNGYMLISRYDWKHPGDSQSDGTTRLPCSTPSDSDVKNHPTVVLHNNTHNNNTQIEQYPAIRPPSRVVKEPDLLEALFKDFWEVYPLKKGKDMARKSFLKLKPADVPMIIMDVMKRKTTDRQWVKDNGLFIPHASTYLNQKRWEDEITPVTVSYKPPTIGEPYTPGKYRDDKALQI